MPDIIDPGTIINVSVYDSTMPGPQGIQGPIGLTGPAGSSGASDLPWAWYSRDGTDVIDPIAPNTGDVVNRWILSDQSGSLFSEFTAAQYSKIGCPQGTYFFELVVAFSESTLTWSGTPTTGITWGKITSNIGGGANNTQSESLVYGEFTSQKNLPYTRLWSGSSAAFGSNGMTFWCTDLTDILGTLTGGLLSFDMYLFVCQLSTTS